LIQAVGVMLQPRSFFTRAMFAFTRATLWRFVEYDKGAAAAIVLLVTIGLGFMKMT
jgi:hypothetical protein